MSCRVNFDVSRDLQTLYCLTFHLMFHFSGNLFVLIAFSLSCSILAFSPRWIGNAVSGIDLPRFQKNPRILFPNKNIIGVKVDSPIKDSSALASFHGDLNMNSAEREVIASPNAPKAIGPYSQVCLENIQNTVYQLLIITC